MGLSPMANDRSKKNNVLVLENVLVALTREIGDGPCFLYIEFSWIGVKPYQKTRKPENSGSGRVGFGYNWDWGYSTRNPKYPDFRVRVWFRKFWVFAHSTKTDTIQAPFCVEKSVQLFKVAFFRSYFLQNPYFNETLISKL